MKKGKMELIVDIPENIEAILNGTEEFASKDGYEHLLSNEILMKRSRIFSHRLMEEVLK
jgi:hypothetical protein